MHINEKLLLEAQKESRSGSKDSRSDSSSSAKTPQSLVHTIDWASNYSSRIELEPPKEWKFLHPVGHNRDEENKVEQLLEKKHIRFVLLSNCASFLLGMGIMYLCLRRYLRLKHLISIH